MKPLDLIIGDKPGVFADPTSRLSNLTLRFLDSLSKSVNEILSLDFLSNLTTIIHGPPPL